MEDNKEQIIKCVVWDLDDTIWHGILLEQQEVVLNPAAVETIKTLDQRGILNSIASKNDEVHAREVLRRLGLDEYFICPQIHWNAKSTSIKTIAATLNMALDAIAFVDDQRWEREEVHFHHPEVMCIDASEIRGICALPCMIPRFITEESCSRRFTYMLDTVRKEEEENYQGTKEEFLASLQMQFHISKAGEQDLQRAEELTIRTNQLNTTGKTYSYDELSYLSTSPKHLLLIAGLKDKLGDYGTIGLLLVAIGEMSWNIKLLLMSCRVMSRGVGGVMLTYVMNLAKQAGAGLQVEFYPNSRNRMMYVTLKFSGFNESVVAGGDAVLENDLSSINAYPDYIELVVEE